MNAWIVLTRLKGLQVLKNAVPQMMMMIHNPDNCHHAEMMILWNLCEN